MRAPASVVVVAALALASGFSSPAEAAEAPTRAEYVARLEQICQPGSLATQRAVQGMRSDVRSERLRLAAAKLARAERIFSRTVSAIARVPRPLDDRQALSRWFAALAKEEVYLARVVASLRAEDIARFQRVSADFIHQGNKANNIVVAFGFNYCAFRPARFQ